jgi:hypothetical protein
LDAADTPHPAIKTEGKTTNKYKETGKRIVYAPVLNIWKKTAKGKKTEISEQ